MKIQKRLVVVVHSNRDWPTASPMLIMYTHDHDFIRGKTSSYFRLPVFLHPLREGKFHPSILHNDNSLSLSPPALSGISDFQLNSKLFLPTIRKNTKELGEADKVKTLFGLLQKGQGRRGGGEGLEEKKKAWSAVQRRRVASKSSSVPGWMPSRQKRLHTRG